MVRLLLLPVLAAAVGQASGRQPPRPEVPDLRVEYCSLLAACKLTPPAGACTPEASRGLPGVTYDEPRCADARELHAHGLSTQDFDSYAVYRFLGKRYRVTYLVEGELPLSPARLAFLLDDLPLAAKLLSRLGQHRYTAEYLDESRRRFRGSKEDNLTGEAARVAGGSREGWLAYFGRGRSKVGLWRLGGQSVARLRFEPVAAPRRGLTYSLQIVVTPETSVINRIMSLGLFRRLVNGQIRDVVDDIDRASRRLAEKGPAALGEGWTAEERARIDAFLALP